MTLNTHIYIQDEVDAKAVFAFCRELIQAPDSYVFTDEAATDYENGTPGDRPDHPTQRMLWGMPGQGLAAWLMVDYDTDGPLRSLSASKAHDEDICNLPSVSWYNEEQGPCDGSDHRPAHYLRVSFDTAYGYSDENGRGCGDLHAEYTARLGTWLDTLEVEWLWENEFTGEIHEGYEQLGQLGKSGRESKDWFQNAVLPAIRATYNI